MIQTLSQKLSEFLVQIQYENIPDKSIRLAKHCFIDYLGATWAAQGNATTNTYRNICCDLGGQGAYRLIGGGATSIGFAAMANGAMGHIMEVDDLQRNSTMHVGITVFPVLLGLAQKIGFDGKRFIEAAICGYETAIRIGETLGKEHYKTFHTTGTAGTFGAAAAAAKYMQLSETQTTDALGHAGTQAAGLWQFLSDGALETKPLHPGKACFNGLLAAEMAEKGISGSCRILEGEKGFCKIGAPKTDISHMLDNLGKGFRIDDICFKNYPCCGQTHSMLDALRYIMDEEHLAGRDIEAVEARVYRQCLDLTSNANPRTLGEARFSLPFCLGSILAHGNLLFSDMTPSILNDELIKKEIPKISLVYDPEIDSLFPKTRPCLVTVKDTNGRSYSRKNLYRRGDPEHPMTTSDVEMKFRSLTNNTLSADRQQQILFWAETMEEQNQIEWLIFGEDQNQTSLHNLRDSSMRREM